jgi:hypothetical protein
MKRTLMGLFASVVLAGTIVAAQDPAAPGQQPPSSPPAAPRQQPPMPPSAPPAAAAAADQKAPDVTITGCLVQGSGPNVFILENAKSSTAAATEKGQKYVLDTASGAKVEFKSHLNHQVRIVGMADTKAAGQAAAPSSTEKDWPKLSARTVTMIADTCPSAS